MATFVGYEKFSDTQLRRASEKWVKQIESWFKKNPKRRVCYSALWYGKQFTFKRADVAGQMETILKDNYLKGKK